MNRKLFIVLLIGGVLMPLGGATVSICRLAAHNVSEARTMYHCVLIGMNLSLALINSSYLWLLK